MLTSCCRSEGSRIIGGIHWGESADNVRCGWWLAWRFGDYDRKRKHVTTRPRKRKGLTDSK